MLNIEREDLKDFINDNMVDILMGRFNGAGVSNKGKIARCSDISCDGCIFRNNCYEASMKSWLNSEYNDITMLKNAYKTEKNITDNVTLNLVDDIVEWLKDKGLLQNENF